MKHLLFLIIIMLLCSISGAADKAGAAAATGAADKFKTEDKANTAVVTGAADKYIATGKAEAADMTGAADKYIAEDKADTADMTGAVDKYIATCKADAADIGLQDILQVYSESASVITYDIGKSSVNIDRSGLYEITGYSNYNSIVVSSNTHAIITFKNLSMDCSSSPVRIMSGGKVEVILTGDNKISCSGTGAGIHVPENAMLIISEKSTGSLHVSGGKGGSGIGGNCLYGENEGTGKIMIKGGSIKAEGGRFGCGIGGGISERYIDYYPEYDSGAGDILICGGNVAAAGGIYSSAGIGGSGAGKKGSIIITGGTVDARSYGAGIGGESSRGKGNDIIISGGRVNAYGNNYAPGIGNSMDTLNTAVIISGGMITARGGFGDRLLDEYVLDYNKESRESLKTHDIAADKIIIGGGNIHAYSLSSQPTDTSGRKVYHAMYNCKKAEITSIKIGNKAYGSRDMVSEGYLSLYLPDRKSVLTIKSKDVTLLKRNIYTGDTSVIRADEFLNPCELDISKGNIEILPEGIIYGNKVYRARIWEPGFIITGKTDSNMVIFHGGRYIHSPSITFRNLKVGFEDSESDSFLLIEDGISAILSLQEENYITLGDDKRGIHIGGGASLSITGENVTDKLFTEMGTGSYAVFTCLGEIRIYSGSLDIDAARDGAGVNLGNLGTLTMYGGLLKLSGDEGMSITGSNHMNVNIHGGSLLAQTLGRYEDANEEIINNSNICITGGSVEAAGRIIFSNIVIYGGAVKARIIGCGTGCSITMYSGIVEVGATAERIIYDGESESSNFNWYLYGGSFINRMDVPEEELALILKETG